LTYTVIESKMMNLKTKILILYRKVLINWLTFNLLDNKYTFNPIIY